MREFIAREGHSEAMGEGEGEEMRTPRAPREGTSASVETLDITPEAAQADDVLDAIDMVLAAKGGGLRLSTVQGGRWGAVLKQGGGPFQTS